MPSSANNTIQYKGRGLLISSLMYHSAPAICRVPFFCNMMQKIFLSSISANRKTAGGENQWNFSRKSLYYKQGQFALESNDIMTACKIQMTSSRFQNIKAILPAHIKMQKSQPNTSDLVFFKALISTERWRHFFHQQTVNHIFVGNMLRVKKTGWLLWFRSNANYFGHSCWRHPRPTLGCLQETPTPLVFCVQAVKH